MKTSEKRNYAEHRERAGERINQMSASGRDIGSVPSIKNVRRRNKCKLDLKLFCKTYLPEAFPLPFSEIHDEMIARLEESVLHGALYAFACPRGSGKTTIARAATLWAVSYSHSKYVFLIGANSGKAVDSLESIKTWIRFIDVYAEDFPEIAYPVRKVNGIAHRCAGMTSEGRSCKIEWSKDFVVLPTVKSPANLAKHKTKDAPSSGTVIAVSGLTGNGIRGSLRSMIDGRQIRPDFVLLDDPQTDESAASAPQNITREKLISGAVLGMAAPGKKISAVMPCTVIAKGDMVDKILDRKKHPLWRGTRAKMIDGWPVNFNLWEKYFEIYRMGALLEPPSYAESNRFYKKNREDMDLGCHATWEARHNEDELSATQHAMNLYCRDQATFFSEFQNEPIVANDETEFLSMGDVMIKQHAHGRNVVPLEVETIKAFVDVQKEQFFVQIWGYSEGFDGYLLDYFSFPQQPSGYFSKKTISETFSKHYPGKGLEARIYAAANDLHDLLFGLKWKRKDDNATMQISRVGMDSRYKTATLRRVYRDSPYQEKITLCMGVAYGAKRKPITQKVTKTGERKGSGWFYTTSRRASVRTLEIDTYFWKTFFHQRLSTAIGDPGSFSLYQVKTPQIHRLVAEHFCAEYRTQLEGSYGKVDEWFMRPGSPDNDYLDCAVGAAAIASFDGLTFLGADFNEGRKRAKKVDWSKWGK